MDESKDLTGSTNVNSEMMEEDLVPLNIKKVSDSIMVKIEFMKILHINLQKKLKKLDEDKKKCRMEVAVNIHLLKEDMDKTCEQFDNLLISLDRQGYWELSEEDRRRIEADEKASSLFKKFLPQMIDHGLTDDSRKDINKGCYIQ